MKKVSSSLLLLYDKKCLAFYVFITFFNVFYLYQNNDNYFIFGYGYGLESLINIDETPNPVLNLNALFLRAFSFLGNLMVFNFIFLMLYNIIFKTFKSV